MIFRSGVRYLSKADENRYASIACIEQGYHEGTMFEYVTEKGEQCRVTPEDFWAAYYKDNTKEDEDDDLVNRLHKKMKSAKKEFDRLKRENKDLKKELEKIKEELEEKKSVLDYSDKYILDLEETRRNNANQIESYKKDLLHVVRSMREGS
ncbi:hypothetical protein [Exiguobacterium sp. s133]|uniref:hypothetical protein n=1 Tax=Exiguobacterium sp. s133 TaxID=2751213 RepID=UPI001BE646BA|nr:hypothetical protein [Exiguobacterium sp. s133]